MDPPKKPASKSLEWNLSSSEDITPKNSRFLKTAESAEMREIKEIPIPPVLAETPEKSETKTKDGILSVLEIIGHEHNFSESLTETGQTERKRQKIFSKNMKSKFSLKN